MWSNRRHQRSGHLFQGRFGPIIIEDDTGLQALFENVAEHLNLEDLRQSLACAAKRLKADKALESCRINGLLFVSLDANEHFHSRSRCCPCCCQREIEVLEELGNRKQSLQ